MSVYQFETPRLADPAATRLADLPVSRSAITMEAIIRAQQQQQAAVVNAAGGSTPISSLLSLARHMPQGSTPASVHSTIQQLLTSLARAQLPTSALPTVLSSTTTLLSSPTKTATSPALHTSLTGSPLQNSVPTLMSSLAKTSSIPASSLLKRMTSVSVDESPSSSAREEPSGLPTHKAASTSQEPTIDLTDDADDDIVSSHNNISSSIQITVSRQGSALVSSIMDQSLPSIVMSLGKPMLSVAPSSVAMAPCLSTIPTPHMTASKLLMANPGLTAQQPQFIATKILPDEPCNTDTFEMQLQSGPAPQADKTAASGGGLCTDTLEQLPDQSVGQAAAVTGDRVPSVDTPSVMDLPPSDTETSTLHVAPGPAGVEEPLGQVASILDHSSTVPMETKASLGEGDGVQDATACPDGQEGSDQTHRQQPAARTATRTRRIRTPKHLDL